MPFRWAITINAYVGVKNLKPLALYKINIEEGLLDWGKMCAMTGLLPLEYKT